MPNYEFRMCNTDEPIERLAPRPSAPLEFPSESRWATETRARRSDAASRRRYVLKAGSAYYHDLDSSHNHWLQHEIVSEEESKVRCDRRLENIEAYRDMKGSSQELRIQRNIVHQLLMLDTLLNDEVINSYIAILNRQITILQNKSYIMDTFHMSFLTDSGKSVSILRGKSTPAEESATWGTIKEKIIARNKRIVKSGVDLSVHDTVLIPMHTRNGAHWELCVIDFRFKRIRMYDSKDNLHSEDEKYFHAVIALHWVSGLKELDATEWKWDIVSKLRGYDIPSQDDENDADCGVLMLKYMESEALGRPLQRMGQMLAKKSDSMKRCREELADTLLS